MPGRPDVKIIIDEGARAICEGRCELAAREAAIDRCIAAGAMTDDEIKAFGEIAREFVLASRAAKANALAAQDKILFPALRK